MDSPDDASDSRRKLSAESFLESTPDAVLLLDKTGRILHINAAARKLFGESAAAIVGTAIQSHVPQKSATRFREALSGLARPLDSANGTAGAEVRSRLSRIEDTTFSFRLSLLENGHSEIVTCWVHDLTEHLRRDEIADQLSTLIESTDDAIIGTDLSGLITVWNPAAERLYGYSAAEVVGKNAADLTVAPVREEEIEHITAELLVAGTVRRFETERLRKDGSPIDVSLSISFVHNRRDEPIGTLAIAHDITEKKRAEAELRAARDELEIRVEERTANLREANLQLENEIAERQAVQAELRRSERLAALGTLAAGIAHELNNPLGLITLELHHARDHANDPEQVRASLDEIERDAKRCAGIVSGVLRFAREEASEKTLGDLNESLRKAVTLTADTRSSCEVRIETFFTEPLPRIRMNDAEIQQLLINLINNAVQASGRNSRIRISTAVEGDGVRIRVCDEGRGMSETERARACDPFYTTRTHEGGTGLGLSICHGIVAEHGGRLEFDSSPEHGTSVTVTLPAAKNANDPAAPGSNTSRCRA